MEAVRRGAGDAFLLGCNHPIWASLGLIHGSRSSNSFSLRGRHHIREVGNDAESGVSAGGLVSRALPGTRGGFLVCTPRT